MWKIDERKVIARLSCWLLDVQNMIKADPAPFTPARIANWSTLAKSNLHNHMEGVWSGVGKTIKTKRYSHRRADDRRTKTHTFDGAGGDDALCCSSITPRYNGGLIEIGTWHHHLLQVLSMVRKNRHNKSGQGFTMWIQVRCLFTRRGTHYC